MKKGKARFEELSAKLSVVEAGDFAYIATGGRTRDVSGVSEEEATAVMEQMEQFLKDKKERELKRKKVFSCFRKLGYIDSAGCLDYGRIRGFLRVYTSTKKQDLNIYTSEELTNLIYQLERMVVKTEAVLTKEKEGSDESF